MQFRVGSKVTAMHHFWVQNGLFPPNKDFFGKTVTIILMYLLALHIVQNFQKVLRTIQVMVTLHFWDQNGPLARKATFKEKVAYFDLAIALLHCVNMKKILRVDIENIKNL